MSATLAALLAIGILNNACLETGTRPGHPPRDVDAITGSDASLLDGGSGEGGSQEGGSTQQRCRTSSCDGVCDPATDACVECIKNNDCKSRFVSKLCDTDTHACVECLESADCKSEAAPHCTSGSCTDCVVDDDCKRFGKVCDEAVAACVECTDSNECKDGKSCDTHDQTCRGTIGVCEACVDNNECRIGHDCVATSFNGAPHGKFCLLRADEGSLCPRQFATWDNGTCFPDSFTTCEAVLGYQSLCPATGNPEDLSLNCGTNDVPGSLCRDSTCTYPCDAHRDCSANSLCSGDAGNRSCRPCVSTDPKNVCP